MPDASIMKAFFVLGSIVACLSLILFVLKRYSKKNRKFENNINLQVLSRISLQPKTHVYLLKAGDSTLLVGVTDHTIATLADLTEISESHPKPTTIKAGTIANARQNLAVNKPMEDSLSFSTFLRSAFRKNTN